MAMNHKKLKKIKDKKKAYILDKYPGVQGIGVSEKERKGKKLGNWALTIYVERKISASNLTVDERIDLDPEILKDLETYDNIDIKEIGKIRKLAAHTMKLRPAETGMSEGHYQITTGTAGILVQDPGTGKVYRLSNNHVYANENKGEEMDPIFQPGPHDGGHIIDTIGFLDRFIPLFFGGLENRVDAALRTTGYNERQVLHNVGRSPTRLSESRPGQSVIKSGRTTGVTTGTISDVSLDIIITYDSGEAWFVDQIMVESPGRFSQGGDSGSSVCLNTEELDWVGVLFAGSDDGRFTICNHALDVKAYLNIDLYYPDGVMPAPPIEEESKSWWKALLNFFKTLLINIGKIFGIEG